MTLKGWDIHFSILHRFPKETISGIYFYKDWEHVFGFDFRIGFKFPHITFLYYYTTDKEYIEKWFYVKSEKYRNSCGGLKTFDKTIIRQDVNDGRCSMG